MVANGWARGLSAVGDRRVGLAAVVRRIVPVAGEPVLGAGCWSPWSSWACELAGLRYISNNRVGIVEKLWSSKGSVPEGGIIALDGEAGFQAEVLRGGLHFGLWRWQYRIHKVPLVTVPQGKIGYVYARDGEPLAAEPDARPGRRVQPLPGRPHVPRR